MYLLPATKNIIQKTLLETGEVGNNKISRTWKDIKEADLSGYSYGVNFKNLENQKLPNTYIIRAKGGVQDIFDIDEDEYTIDADREQAQASTALESTSLTTYIKAQLNDVLIYIAFDPENMILVDEKKTENT